MFNLFLEKSFRNTWSFNHLNNFFPQKGQIHQIIYQYIQKTSQQKLTGFTTRKNSCTVPSPFLFAPFLFNSFLDSGRLPEGDSKNPLQRVRRWTSTGVQPRRHESSRFSNCVVDPGFSSWIAQPGRQKRGWNSAKTSRNGTNLDPLAFQLSVRSTMHVGMPPKWHATNCTRARLGNECNFYRSGTARLTISGSQCSGTGSFV